MKALEPQNLKKTILITAIIVMLAVGGFAYFMFKLIEENAACMTNPLVYGLDHIASSDGKEVFPMCTCNVEQVTFTVDKYKVHPQEKTVYTRTVTSSNSINLTGIKLE